MMSPSRALDIASLQANPIPMLLSLTYFKFCLSLSSKNGMKSIFCLSSSIPIPVSMIWVSSMWSWPFLTQSGFRGKQSIKITMSPLNWLYFTEFWMMLKRISWYFTQFAFISKFKGRLRAKWTFIPCLEIWGSKGYITLLMYSSGFLHDLICYLNSFYLIFILWIWLVL